jgi:hypothetical protein
MVPTGLFTGSQDKLADPSDVSKIVKQMNPKYLVYQFNVNYYEHMGMCLVACSRVAMFLATDAGEMRVCCRLYLGHGCAYGIVSSGDELDAKVFASLKRC